MISLGSEFPSHYFHSTFFFCFTLHCRSSFKSFLSKLGHSGEVAIAALDEEEDIAIQLWLMSPDTDLHAHSTSYFYHVDFEAKWKILQAWVFAQVFSFLSYLFCFSLEHPVKKIKATCCVLRGVDIRNIVSLETFKSSLLRIYICSLSRVTSHGLKCVNKHPQVKK